MHNTRVQRCTCGHPKSIHLRMYGPMYEHTKLPQSCNFPDCKCKIFKLAPAKPKQK